MGRRRGVMKTIHQKSHIKIPADVTVEVKSRVVKVTGERGTLGRNFRHMDVDIKHNKDANTITVDKWLGNKKELVFAHFPVNVGVADSGDHITVMNFIGQKVKFEVDALPGCKIVKDPKNQTEFHVEGNDIENVSRTCALISQSCKVRNKDIRKFLDGIYVCEKTNVVVEEE